VKATSIRRLGQDRTDSGTPCLRGNKHGDPLLWYAELDRPWWTSTSTASPCQSKSLVHRQNGLRGGDGGFVFRQDQAQFTRGSADRAFLVRDCTASDIASALTGRSCNPNVSAQMTDLLSLLPTQPFAYHHGCHRNGHWL
jgi:hypothetical protein